MGSRLPGEASMSRVARLVTSAVCGVSNPGSHLPSSPSSCLRLLNHCGDHSPGTAPRNLQMMDSNSFHRQSHCSCRHDRILRTSAPAVESRNLAPELLIASRNFFLSFPPPQTNRLSHCAMSGHWPKRDFELCKVVFGAAVSAHPHPPGCELQLTHHCRSVRSCMLGKEPRYAFTHHPRS